VGNSRQAFSIDMCIDKPILNGKKKQAMPDFTYTINRLLILKKYYFLNVEPKNQANITLSTG